MWHLTDMTESSDSQLQTAACPSCGHKGFCYQQTHKQRSGFAAGMDCNGVHCSADSSKTFQKKRRVFHPLVCFNCTVLHLMSWTIREKTEVAQKGWDERERKVKVLLGCA
ncbi:hypothetical protein AMECASPLE_017068 [Ameca splendens]|uniref:Uncharacterized protein n=1 Tax=Ameca splendens TaxID=208324 RepID=A0ABV0Z0J9_9TELE